MRIQHNIMAMNAYRHYTNNVSAMKKNLEKLSSGYRINRAGDDAAGLAISEKMRAQITGLETAQKNAKNGINLVQTAEGALTEVHDMLNRMYELAEQSANGTYDNETDRVQLQKEVNSLREEIDRISKASNFNGINLLDGTLGMNTKAFSLDTVGATPAQAVSGFVKDILPIANGAAPVAGTNTILHEDSSNAVLGEFTIDFGQTSITHGTGANSFTLNILGANFTITEGTASNADLNGDGIAALVADKFKGDGNLGLDTTNVQNHLQIKNDGTIAATSSGQSGSLYLAAKADGSKVTFKVVGYGDSSNNATAFNTTSAATLNADMDKVNANAIFDFNSKSIVTVSDPANTAANGTVNGLLNISYTDVINNAKQNAGAFGNTTLELDMESITDGDILEIAGAKYTFAIGKDSTHKTDAGVIDLTDIVKDATDLSGTGTALTAQQKSAIMAKITDAVAGNTEVTVGNKAGEWGKLGIAEAVKTGASQATQPYMDMMSNINTFKNIVSLTHQASNKGIAIKGTDADIKEGDTLQIGDKKYIFGTGTNDTKTTYISVADGMAGLDQALTTDGVSHKFDSSSNTVTVYGSATKYPSVGGAGLVLQIGDTADSFNQLGVSVKSCNAAGMGIDGIDISTQAGAQAALDVIKEAVNYISDVRGDLGATQNRLDHTINNLAAMTENIQDAESTIRDVDIAEEMMAYTKNNILIQSAQAMLAQANQVPQGVLQLLQ